MRMSCARSFSGAGSLLRRDHHVDSCDVRAARCARASRDEKQFVIAHPTLAMCSTGSLVDSTNRKVSSTEAPLTFAVLTTERKAA